MRNLVPALFGWVVLNQLGLPVPACPTLVGAGIFLGRGDGSLPLILSVAVIGTLLADLAWFGIGRWHGSGAIDRLAKLARRSPEWMKRAEDRYHDHKVLFLLAAPFLPAVNPFASGLAGALGMRLSAYLLCALGSAVAWTVVWVGVGYMSSHLF